MTDLSHWVTVAELKTLLGRLLPDDELWPNDLRNVVVVRDTIAIGYIDFLGIRHEDRLEFFDEDEDE